MKYLKTYEGLFDFLKRKYKQVVEEPEEPEEPEESSQDSKESEESREVKKSKPQKPQPKVDYNELVNRSLKTLKSLESYLQYKVSNVVTGDSTWEFDVEQVKEGLVAKFRLELSNNNRGISVLEISYPDFDIKKTINFPNHRMSYYKIHEMIEDCKSEVFKKEFPLEDIKDYFSDLSDLIEGEIKYQFENYKVISWSVKLCVDKTFPRGVRRDMDKLIKSQSLDLEVLKELKNLNLRLSNLGLVAVFEKEQIWDGQSRWNGYLVNVMRKSDLGVHSDEVDESDEEDEEYWED